MSYCFRTIGRMNQEQASQHLNSWLAATKLLDLPLLAVRPDGITPVLHARGRPRLSCSDQLMATIKTVSSAIIADWNGPRVIEGIGYLVYRRGPDGSPEPVYVGIANSAGKNGTGHSVLWKTRGARFCDGYESNGHVDCLSRSLLEGYAGYSNWVSTLFGPGAGLRHGSVPALLRPVYVHIDLFGPNSRRILPAAPGAPLYVEEMLRLWVLKAAGYGPQLLNRDGN